MDQRRQTLFKELTEQSIGESHREERGKNWNFSEFLPYVKDNELNFCFN